MAAAGTVKRSSFGGLESGFAKAHRKSIETNRLSSLSQPERTAAETPARNCFRGRLLKTFIKALE
jgi:hypothetical protein